MEVSYSKSVSRNRSLVKKEVMSRRDIVWVYDTAAADIQNDLVIELAVVLKILQKIMRRRRALLFFAQLVIDLLKQLYTILEGFAGT